MFERERERERSDWVGMGRHTLLRPRSKDERLELTCLGGSKFRNLRREPQLNMSGIQVVVLLVKSVWLWCMPCW